MDIDMEIEFIEDAQTQVENALDSGEKAVRSFLSRLDIKNEIAQAAISSISPGLSGAGVFKITRMGRDNKPKTTLLLKISRDIELIEAEQNNYDKYVRDNWQETPKLLRSETNFLIYEFGGHLLNFKPLTLRAGYASSNANALSNLMKRLVQSLRNIHMIGHDNVSFVKRVKFKKNPLDKQLKSSLLIPEEKATKLIELWNWLQENFDKYPSICCEQGHGDLNSGNVLFQPDNKDSIPVFIDFASMINKGHKKTGEALPFCDYAKIERDLKTRMFLKEAIKEQLTLPEILSAIHDIDLGNEPSSEKPRKSVQKLAKVIRTLRKEIEWNYPPMAFKGAYNVVIAITSLSVLYRENPDTDVCPEFQQNVAVESAITLLEEAQQNILMGDLEIGATSKKKDTEVTNTQLQILKTADIRSLYEDMDQGAFAWIFSTDGFIETKEPAFFDIIQRAVEKGINIYYFFPHTNRGKVSLDAFTEILQRLIHEIDDSVLEKVQGFFVSAEVMTLSAESSRFVVFGESKEKKEITRILLYVHSGGNFWIDMKVDMLDDFIADIKRAIDRVKCLPLKVWHNKWELPSEVKDHYRVSFHPSASGGEYQDVRDLLHTKEYVAALSKRVAEKFKTRTSKQRPYLEWLDVGCENGENTAVVFNSLKEKQIKISLQAIETSFQDQKKVNDVLRYSPFLNGTEWSFEKFIEKTQFNYEFDLITSVHSWYVIDPIYLIHAYRILSPNGIIALIIAPYKNNVLNTIIGAIDKYIADSKHFTCQAYKEKVIVDDPYRNFAEDIVLACSKFFGETGVDITKRTVLIPRAQLMIDRKLTESAKKLVRFFCHGIIDADEALYKQVEIAIDIYQDKESFPCEEWDIILDRKLIASSPDLNSFTKNPNP